MQVFWGLHGLFVFCAIVSLKEKPERNFALLYCYASGKITWEIFLVITN
jgi:hypothetical protein